MSFKPLLAESPNPKFPLRFPFYASPKYDGIRCIISQLGPVTRKLKPIRNKALCHALNLHCMRGFDGELVAGPPFASDAMQTTTSAVMAYDSDWNGVVYYAFDYITAVTQHEPYDIRKKYLEQWINQAKEICKVPLVLVEQILVHNEDELAQYEQIQINLGYEGVILRHPDGQYKYGRSTAREQIMLKIKRFVDTEGEIIGFFEQETNTNEQERDALGYAKRSSAQYGKVGLGTLGGMIVKLGREWASETVLVGTGQGWTKEFRQRVWDNQDQYLGKILKYKYQDVGSKLAPRIPIGLGFRDLDDLEGMEL